MNDLFCYLIIICIAGFVLQTTEIYTKKKSSSFSLGYILPVIAVLGGSFGILLSVLLFDRRPSKDNMMVRLITVCVFIVELLLLLFVFNHKGRINFDIITFLLSHRFLLFYLLILNIITFFVFAADKLLAVKDGSRIRIVTLLGFCFAGGSIGGLLAMYIFRHKIRVNYFTAGIPLIVFTQLIVLFYSANTF